MKNITIFLLFFLMQIMQTSSAQDLEEKHHPIIQTFIESVKSRNIDHLKKLVRYPLKRQYPLASIADEADFISQYDVIFDPILTKEISESTVRSNWSSVGWRGIMLNRGSLWIDYDGKLIAINYQSNAEKIQRSKLIEIDKQAIHNSINNYSRPITILKTNKFRIRIDELEDDTYRYTSWPINSSMKDKPSLVLTNGQFIADGTGGNHRYVFENGNYKYVCSINVLGTSETPPADLVVYKNENRILYQAAVIIIN